MRRALTRSRAGVDVGGEPGDEVVDADAALGRVAPPPVHADGAVLDVVVADHQHVRHLLELGPADARAERVGVRVDQLGAEAVGAQPVDELAARTRRGGRRPAAPSTCTGASHAGNAPA